MNHTPNINEKLTLLFHHLLHRHRYWLPKRKNYPVDSSQVTEYRDLTMDLDEMSSKMFPKLMQSALAQSNYYATAQACNWSDDSTNFCRIPEALRINRLRNMITQSGLAKISGSSSNSTLNEYIRFAKSQQGRSETNLP